MPSYMKASLRNIKLNATGHQIKVDKNLPASKGTPQFLKASPVPHLLTCNTPPNDEEISLIRTAVLDTNTNYLRWIKRYQTVTQTRVSIEEK